MRRCLCRLIATIMSTCTCLFVRWYLELKAKACWWTLPQRCVVSCVWNRAAFTFWFSLPILPDHYHVMKLFQPTCPWSQNVRNLWRPSNAQHIQIHWCRVADLCVAKHQKHQLIGQSTAADSCRQYWACRLQEKVTSKAVSRCLSLDKRGDVWTVWIDKCFAWLWVLCHSRSFFSVLPMTIWPGTLVAEVALGISSRSIKETKGWSDSRYPSGDTRGQSGKKASSAFSKS